MEVSTIIFEYNLILRCVKDWKDAWHDFKVDYFKIEEILTISNLYIHLGVEQKK